MEQGGKERSWESSVCGKATKGTAKEVEESRGGRGSVHGQATRSAARKVKEKPGAHLMTEDAGIMWRRHSRWGMPIRVGVVYERSDCDVCGV